MWKGAFPPCHPSSCIITVYPVGGSSKHRRVSDVEDNCVKAKSKGGGRFGVL